MQRRRDDSATVSRGKCRRLPARYEACAASQMPVVPGSGEWPTVQAMRTEVLLAGA